MKTKTRTPVNITLSHKLVKQINDYKMIHPEFNLSRKIELLLVLYFNDSRPRSDP